MINPPQQRGSPSQVGMIFHAVDGVGGSDIYVSRYCDLLDLGIMPPEPPHDVAAAERLIQLPDALLEHGPYQHGHIVHDPGGRRIIEQIAAVSWLSAVQAGRSCHEHSARSCRGQSALNCRRPGEHAGLCVPSDGYPAGIAGHLRFRALVPPVGNANPGNGRAGRGLEGLPG